MAAHFAAGDLAQRRHFRRAALLREGAAGMEAAPGGRIKRAWHVAFERLGAGGGLPAMLVALVIGMPLYVCTTASVPIAAALVYNGFPPGAAMVFLISGPATNLATMGAIYRVLGRRVLGKYLTTIAVGSVAFGLLFELVIDPGVSIPAHMHDGHSWWGTACAAILAAMFGWFAWEDARRWLADRRRAAAAPRSTALEAAPRTVEVPVQGMTCESCASRLQRTIGRERGVSSVEVTLEPGRAIVHGDVSDQRVRELVELAGFRAR